MEPVRKDSMEVGRTKATAWGLPFILGLLTSLLGIFCLIAAYAAGLAAVMVAGVMLIVGGCFEIGFGFGHRREGLLLPVLSGILSIVVGFLVLRRPAVGLSAAALVIACYFFASGLFRGITAIADRFANWGWDFAYGVSAVILGVIILASWPQSSAWMVGTLVGIELLFRGGALMGDSTRLRSLMRHHEPTALT